MENREIEPLESSMVHGVSRRTFLQYCATLASLMALPSSAGVAFSKALSSVSRPPVIWLSFQDCGGCTESLIRSNVPTLEDLLFNSLSLEYHQAFQISAGIATEAARKDVVQKNWGKYLLIVDGSIPMKEEGVYSTTAGVSHYDLLMEMAKGAAAVIAMGTCAVSGGLSRAYPNPTGATAISRLIKDKPVINLPGCPPIPVVMTGVLIYYLTFGAFPELDALGRPKAFYGETVHDRCYRRPFYEQGKFAKSFDDEGARQGWCLFELGCKGHITHNACSTKKWNGAVSFPIESGHGCLGCSEPGFLDTGSFYRALSLPEKPIGHAVNALMAGAMVGGSMFMTNRGFKMVAAHTHLPSCVADLEKESGG